MVIGAFASSGDAEVCLTNLGEAGFTPHMISVVADDPACAATLPTAKGPLHARPVTTAWAALRELGVAESTLANYAPILAGGGVLIALTVPVDLNPVAEEMLTDHHVIGLAATEGNLTSVKR